MGDLVTKLLLKSDQFDAALKKSGSQVGSFQHKTAQAGGDVSVFEKKISSLGQVAGSSLMKFAGYAGLAVGGLEALEKTMRGSQTTSDMFDNAINAAKGSVDMFFSSLSRGDWSAFENGILSVFSKLKDLSAALDELADKKLSLNYIRAEELKEVRKWEEIAKDTTRPIKERNEAAKKMSEEIEKLAAAIAETSDFEINTILKDYNARSGMNFDIGDIRKFARETNFKGEATSEASKAYKEWLRLKKEQGEAQKKATYDANTYGFDPDRKYQKKSREASDKYRSYTKENESLIKQGWLAEESDPLRKGTLEALMAQFQAENEIYGLRQRSNRVRDRVASDAQRDAKAYNDASKKSYQEQSDIQGVQNQTQDWVSNSIQKILFPEPVSVPIALTDEEIEGLSQDEIANLKIKKALNLKIPVKPDFMESDETGEWQENTKGSIEDLEEQIRFFTIAYNKATTDELRDMYSKRIEYLREYLDQMRGEVEDMIDIAGSLNSAIQGGVSSAFESIGEIIASGEGGDFADSLISLMDLLKQFGSALVAAGLARLAFEKLMVRPLAAIAAGGALIVASSVASSALKKVAKPMAQGGVVYSETFARVGEYAGASSNPEIVAPLDRLRALIQPSAENNVNWGGVLEVRMRGRDMYGLLKKIENVNERTK